MPNLELLGALLRGLRARLLLRGGENTVTASHSPYILLDGYFRTQASDTLQNLWRAIIHLIESI